jgi:GDP-4-dehydro-6-deoxy-D-mannose reductase
VCSGRDIAIADVAARLQHLAGTELRLELDPSLARPVDVPVVRGDPTKLHEATGWEPSFSLDQTLLDVLEQWSGRAV